MSFATRHVIAVLALATLALLLWLPRLNGPIDLRWDGGAYYVLGTSLAEGRGYRLLSEPGNIQTTLHPPLLPAIIAIHQKVLRTNDIVVVGIWLRRTYFLLFIAYIVAGYFMLRVFLPVGYAFLASLVCLFQLDTVFMSDLCFPEIPFGLATVLFAICHFAKEGSTARWLRVPLAIVSYALRTAGIALFAAWTFESICERNLKSTIRRGLIAALSVLGWAGYVACVEFSHEYANPAYEYQRADYAYINVSYARNLKYKDPFSPELGYASLKERVSACLTNLAVMSSSLGEAVSTREPLQNLLRAEFNTRAGYSVLPDGIVRLSTLFLTALIVGGISLQLSRRQYFVPLYVFFSVAVICSTPWPGQFNRYLAPLVFFLSLSLFLALHWVVERGRHLFPGKDRIVELTTIGAVTCMIFASQIPILFAMFTKWHQGVVYEFRDEEEVHSRLFFYSDQYRATDTGLDWLKRRASNGDVLATTDPQWSYLRTGLKTVLPPFEVDADRAQRLLDSVPVKFLVVDDGVYRKYTARVVTAHPEQWHRIYAEPAEAGEKAMLQIYERRNRP